MTENAAKELDLEMEKQFVTEINNSCCKEGKELEPKKSAKIFHKLGLIYKNRSPDKIALIQGAALLNAAIVRNPDNVEEIKQDLKIFCDQLLDTANAYYKCADLVALSFQIKQEIIQLRVKTEELLANLSFIPMEISDQQFAVAKENKIRSITSLQLNISETFKKIMRRVAWISKSIMGKPPCEFSLVGLGSLVRKEVTPYSDFESIIILEEGVQHRKGYEKVLEYFRWFSVIFQIVLINLGETILPCVNISSLSGFYDENTPRGISSDGMVPYACKNPLGRPFVTPKKPFTLELIQPVSIMANFTDLDQDLKNGYHLADMLMTTTFVAGNILIYHQFEKQIWQKIQLSSPNEEGAFSPIYNQLEENKIELRQAFNAFAGKMNTSVKKIFYRTSTLFIAALGKIHKIREGSCFEIVDKLYELQKISAIDKLNLKFAVAVACETRLQFYVKNKSQFDLTKYLSDTDGVLKLCGERSIVEYIAITTTIQNNILQKNMDFTLKPHVMLKAYYNLQLYKATVAWNNSHLHEYENLNDEEKGIAYRFLGISKLRMKDCTGCVTDLEKAEKIFRPITLGPIFALGHLLTCQHFRKLGEREDPVAKTRPDKSETTWVDNEFFENIKDHRNVLADNKLVHKFPLLKPYADLAKKKLVSTFQQFAEKNTNKKFEYLIEFVRAAFKSKGGENINHYDMWGILGASIPEINSKEDYERFLSFLKPIVMHFFSEGRFDKSHPETSKIILGYFRYIKDPGHPSSSRGDKEHEPPLD